MLYHSVHKSLEHRAVVFSALRVLADANLPVLALDPRPVRARRLGWRLGLLNILPGLPRSTRPALYGRWGRWWPWWAAGGSRCEGSKTESANYSGDEILWNSIEIPGRGPGQRVVFAPCSQVGSGGSPRQPQDDPAQRNHIRSSRSGPRPTTTPSIALPPESESTPEK